MSAIAKLQHDLLHSRYYHDLAIRAKKVFIDKLWNGHYLNYDSSASVHHNSIMADMMAGQWYCHVCHLPPVVTPKIALSCFEVIYRYNVCEFGNGKFMGAVNGEQPEKHVYNIYAVVVIIFFCDVYCLYYDYRNHFLHHIITFIRIVVGNIILLGMRPPSHLVRPNYIPDVNSIRLGISHIGIAAYITSIYSWFTNPSGTESLGNNEGNHDGGGDDDDDFGTKAVVDNACMQSREVWTGTTYALAAAMIHESYYTSLDDGTSEGIDNGSTVGDNDKEQLTDEERLRLRWMAYNTARGTCLQYM